MKNFLKLCLFAFLLLCAPDADAQTTITDAGWYRVGSTSATQADGTFNLIDVTAADTLKIYTAVDYKNYNSDRRNIFVRGTQFYVGNIFTKLRYLQKSVTSPIYIEAYIEPNAGQQVQVSVASGSFSAMSTVAFTPGTIPSDYDQRPQVFTVSQLEFSSSIYTPTISANPGGVDSDADPTNEIQSAGEVNVTGGAYVGNTVEEALNALGSQNQLSERRYITQNTPPEDTTVIWIDSSSGNNRTWAYNKYHKGSWFPFLYENQFTGAKANKKVTLFGTGQSNMNQYSRTGANVLSSNKHIVEYVENSGWKEFDGISTSLVHEAARHIVAKYESQGDSVIVEIARVNQGGQSVTQWQPDSTLNVRIQNLFAAWQPDFVDYFMWHQGEQDVSMNTLTYQNLWKAMRSDLIADIPAIKKETQFVAGEVNQINRPASNYNLSFLNTDGDASTSLVSSAGIIPNDGTHFGNGTTAGIKNLEVFAARYVAAFDSYLDSRNYFAYNAGSNSFFLDDLGDRNNNNLQFSSNFFLFQNTPARSDFSAFIQNAAVFGDDNLGLINSASSNFNIFGQANGKSLRSIQKTAIVGNNNIGGDTTSLEVAVFGVNNNRNLGAGSKGQLLRNFIVGNNNFNNATQRNNSTAFGNNNGTGNSFANVHFWGNNLSASKASQYVFQYSSFKTAQYELEFAESQTGKVWQYDNNANKWEGDFIENAFYENPNGNNTLGEFLNTLGGDNVTYTITKNNNQINLLADGNTVSSANDDNYEAFRVLSTFTPATTDWNTLTDFNQNRIQVNASTPNRPPGAATVYNLHILGRLSDGNLQQLATAYTGTTAEIWLRKRLGGNWSQWVSLHNSWGAEAFQTIDANTLCGQGVQGIRVLLNATSPNIPAGAGAGWLEAIVRPGQNAVRQYYHAYSSTSYNIWSRFSPDCSNYSDWKLVSNVGLSDVLSVSRDAGGQEILNVSNPTSPQSVATKDYVDSRPGDDFGGHTATQTVDMSGNLITDLEGILFSDNNSDSEQWLFGENSVTGQINLGIDNVSAYGFRNDNLNATDPNQVLRLRDLESRLDTFSVVQQIHTRDFGGSVGESAHYFYIDENLSESALVDITYSVFSVSDANMDLTLKQYDPTGQPTGVNTNFVLLAGDSFVTIPNPPGLVAGTKLVIEITDVNNSTTPATGGDLIVRYAK